MPRDARVRRGQDPWKRDHYCEHSGARLFYSFRSAEAAVGERDEMAVSLRAQRIFVSPVYRSAIEGWVWSVCAECAGPGPGPSSP